MNFQILNSINFDFRLISKYRTELMGIGAIGVILAHNLRWNDWPFLLAFPGRVVAILVFLYRRFLVSFRFWPIFLFCKELKCKGFLYHAFGTFSDTFLAHNSSVCDSELDVWF